MLNMPGMGKGYQGRLCAQQTPDDLVHTYDYAVHCINSTRSIDCRSEQPSQPNSLNYYNTQALEVTQHHRRPISKGSI